MMRHLTHYALPLKGGGRPQSDRVGAIKTISEFFSHPHPDLPPSRGKELVWCIVLLTIFFGLTVPAFASMTEYPKVRLRSLDKITARTMTFDARVGTTIKFGSIYIKIQSCQKPDLQDRPEAAAFLQVWEITPDEQSKWIFSGWMFASSPAVSAMDHPVYDVWVIDCLSADNKPAVPKVETPPIIPPEAVTGTTTQTDDADIDTTPVQ